MICFDYFLLMKFHFFQHYYPETQSALAGRKYGFNIKSQLLKILVIFPAASAIAAVQPVHVVSVLIQAPPCDLHPSFGSVGWRRLSR